MQRAIVKPFTCDFQPSRRRIVLATAVAVMLPACTTKSHQVPLEISANGCGGGGTVLALVDLVRNDPPPRTDYDLGKLTLPISINVQDSSRRQYVQGMFDQGLRFIYAFNFREAYRAFREARAKDPLCVMCAWGLAMSLGVNLNQPEQPEQDRLAAAAALAEVKDSRGAQPWETALARALSYRYEPNWDVEESARQAVRDKNYAIRMRAVADAFGAMPDIQTFYIDAVMNTRRWNYWSRDGKPLSFEVADAVQRLDQALGRFPNHMGLIHWSIHLVEASANPGRFPQYGKLGMLAPDSGHLLHMPSHIDYRLGEHAKSVMENRQAYRKDKEYFARQPNLAHPDGDRYRWGYYRHNIHFMLASAIMTGSRSDVDEAAQSLLESENLRVTMRTDRYRGVYYQALVAFRSPSEIRGWRKPSTETDIDMSFATLSWYYAQVLALVRLEQLTPATRYQSLLDEAVKAYASKAGVSQSDIDAAMIMERIARARLYQRQGRLDDAIAQLDFAASLQDHMDYDEPPHWMTPVGQTLGALKIAKGDWNGAIKDFRDSLGLDQTPDYNPYTNFRGNGWAYYGLTVAYQKKKLNGGLTPKEQTDYDAAKSDLRKYWIGEGLAPSLLDRM